MGKFKKGHKKVGGRKKGVPTKSVKEARELIEQISVAMARGDRSGLERGLRTAMSRAIAGDMIALKLLLEHRFGKPTQTITNKGEFDPTKFPFILTLPPKELDK